MKRVIIYLFLAVFIFSSCLDEHTDGCPAMRNLTFTHYCLYDPDMNYDNWIGNDVVLYVYRGKKVIYTDCIPYDKIKNGQTYSYQKQCEGEVDVVAWAVKAGSLTLTPECSMGEDFYSRLLGVEKWTRATAYKTHCTDLYLGTVTLTDDVINQETTHEIRMINTAYLMTVNVEDNFNQAGNDVSDFYIAVDGVMQQENMRYQGVGEQAEMREPLSGSGGNYSAEFGVFPSSESQTVNVYVYKGTTRLATISTGQQAVAGGRMVVNINLGVQVSIVVNDWDLYLSDVKWM